MGKAVIFLPCTEFIEEINLCLELSSLEFALIAYLYVSGVQWEIGWLSNTCLKG